MQRALPDGTTVPERVRVMVTALAAADPLRFDRRAEAVVATARTLLSSLVESLPLVDGAPRRARREGRRIAARLWPRLSPLRATAARVRALDAALVLLADHELAASALAGPDRGIDVGRPLPRRARRVSPRPAVRSTVARRARPASCSRPSRTARLPRLRSATSSGAAIWCPGSVTACTKAPTRAAIALLDAVATLRAPAAVLRGADDILAVMARRGGPPVNIDFALAVFSESCSMVPDAGEAIFELGRTLRGPRRARHGGVRAPPAVSATRAAYVGPPVTRRR